MSDEPRQRGPEARLAQAFAMGRVEMAHEPVHLAAAEGVVVGQTVVLGELQRKELPLETALARLVVHGLVHKPPLRVRHDETLFAGGELRRHLQRGGLLGGVFPPVSPFAVHGRTSVARISASTGSGP